MARLLSSELRSVILESKQPALGHRKKIITCSGTSAGKILPVPCPQPRDPISRVKFCPCFSRALRRVRCTPSGRAPGHTPVQTHLGKPQSGGFGVRSRAYGGGAASAGRDLVCPGWLPSEPVRGPASLTGLVPVASLSATRQQDPGSPAPWQGGRTSVGHIPRPGTRAPRLCAFGGLAVSSSRSLQGAGGGWLLPFPRREGPRGLLLWEDSWTGATPS